MKNSFTYFIYYRFKNKAGGSGYGNMTTTMSHPIRNIEDIKKIELSIKLEYKKTIESVAVVNIVSL